MMPSLTHGICPPLTQKEQQGFYKPVFRRDVLWYSAVQVSVRHKSQFSALFSYRLWRIELKFCMSLSSYKHLMKLEYRQFLSFFGVFTLLELRILEIHSFPHFSFTWFDMLSWNFAYDFDLPYLRSSVSVVNLRQFCRSYVPYGT